MAYPTGHTPEARDGVEGLLAQIATSVGAITDDASSVEDKLASIAVALQSAGLAVASSDYTHLVDRKASAEGGTFTQDAWRTRTLNTILSSGNGFVALSSNQFTLSEGTYLAMISAPAFNVQRHAAKLYNITDAENTLEGTSEFVLGNVTTRSLIIGRFTITAQKVFEVQHYCQSTVADNGFGLAFTGAGSVGIENIYTSVEIWKE